MRPTSPQQAIGSATPTSSADRLLLRSRPRAYQTPGLNSLLDESSGAGQIEDSFEKTRNELGSIITKRAAGHGWRRHVSLVMLAFAMMATIRVHANTTTPPPKTMRRKAKTLHPRQS
jgi:hypothetical protein